MRRVCKMCQAFCLVYLCLTALNLCALLRLVYFCDTLTPTDITVKCQIQYCRYATVGLQLINFLFEF